MNLKIQIALPSDVTVHRLAAVKTFTGSPFWHRSVARMASRHSIVVNNRKEALECDDCGRRTQLREVGADEMGPQYLCQPCIKEKGTEYSNG